MIPEKISLLRFSVSLILLAVVCALLPHTLLAQAANVETPDSARDMTIIRDRLLEPLMKSGRIETVTKIMETQRPDGSWPDVDYESLNRSNWPAAGHLSKVLTMTKTLKTQSELHDNKALRTAVYKGLDYWLDKDFQNPNWWWNVIGVPGRMARILLLLDDELSETRRAKGVEIVKRAKLGMTGANLVDVANITIMRGVVEKKPAVIAEAVEKIAGEINISEGEGIQADYSFHQHGAILYNHGYGAVFMSNCSYLATVIAGTAFEFKREKIMLLNNLILDGTRYMTRFATKDYGATGRGITRRSGDNDSAGYLRGVVDNMLKISTGRKSEYLVFKAKLNAQADDQNYPYLAGDFINRHFWRGDIMTHSVQNFYASVRMHSDRLFSNDPLINDEGYFTHHLSDGCTYIMRTGKEYHDIFPVWDWKKIPGTTVELKELPPGDVKRSGTTSFVGGVSNGFTGVAAFDFERDGLRAKKSWFFLGEAIACLGAGISSSSGNQIITTINQCFLEGLVKVAGKGEWDMIDKGRHSYDSSLTVSHDKVQYHVEEPGNLHLTNDTQSGNWWRINHSFPKAEISRDVFSLWIDHGKNPVDAGYAYVISVYPEILTFASLKKPEPHSLKILTNTSKLQAVISKEHNRGGAVFYEPGSVEFSQFFTLGVDKPCIVLVHSSMVSVSNPKNEALTVTLDINGKKEIFDLPGGMYAGQSLTKNITLEPVLK